MRVPNVPFMFPITLQNFLKEIIFINSLEQAKSVAFEIGFSHKQVLVYLIKHENSG